MGRWGGRDSIKAGARDDWSPEAREAAAKARAAHSHHKQQQSHHEGEAKGRGESLATPPHGSHAEAASHHGGAAFWHGKAAEAHESGKSAEEAEKKAKRYSGIANSASKKLASGSQAYPTEKSNNYGTPTTTRGERREAAFRD